MSLDGRRFGTLVTRPMGDAFAVDYHYRFVYVINYIINFIAIHGYIAGGMKYTGLMHRIRKSCAASLMGPQ